MSDSEIQIPGYTINRRDCNQHGWGLIFFLLKINGHVVLIVHKVETLEFQTVDIKFLNSPRINLGVVNRLSNRS